MTSYDEESVENLRRYIQIPSISNVTNYEECVKFLQAQAKSIGLECQVVLLKPNRPAVIMKWLGTKRDLPAICLNSHMDVVPVEAEKWTYPPFAAHVDQDERIYGRGTQDMKTLGIQHLEAIKRLKREGTSLARTVVVTFVPDEELGGQEGMKLLVETKAFRELRIGFVLDEGAPCNRPGYFNLYYAEKHKWSVKFHVTGAVGHACVLFPNTAASKLAKLLKILYDYREGQYELAKGNVVGTNVVALNATMIEGGSQENVIPSEFVVNCDIRLPPEIDVEEWKATLRTWCEGAGEGTWIEEVVCEIIDKPTRFDESNPYYQPFVETIREMGYELLPQVCPAVTDARFLRQSGIPVFNFSPLSGEMLMHQHDEFIEKKSFLFGIGVYSNLLLRLGHLPNYN